MQQNKSKIGLQPTNRKSRYLMHGYAEFDTIMDFGITT